MEFSPNAIGETGKSVGNDFEYSSGNNQDFLTVEQIAQLNKSVVIE